MDRVKLTKREMTPEEAEKAKEMFNRIHADAREAAAKDQNHPYNGYLLLMSGGYEEVMKGLESPDAQKED